MKKRRALFKSRGICVNCLRRNAKKGSVSCKKCLADKIITQTIRGRGISRSDYELRVTKQGGRCAICNRKKRLLTDHCHKKMKFRGLLCNGCNVGLGLFMDSVKLLNRAIEYLSPTRSA